MKIIVSEWEIKRMEEYSSIAAKFAKQSTCKKSQGGALVVRNGEMIGFGYNKVTSETLCNPCVREDIHDNSRVELCSAIHAEQIALLDAFNRYGRAARGSLMYYIKIKNGEPVYSGQPSCTVCSRLLFEAQISLVLWQEQGYIIYEPEEINKLSFEYFLKGRQ